MTNTEPATFVFSQGIVVVPVPNGKLLTMVDMVGVPGAIGGQKPGGGQPGCWIVAE